MNYLANPSISLNLRTQMADLALELANALIEKELALADNRRKHTAEEDSDAIMARAEAAINADFDIRAKMAKIAAEIRNSL